ncbi:hypothetical protein E0L36_14540 [Streptomyces sp. AJS327]|nr:hypothetical protein [Streptomyces sp. AJS327]
MSTTVPRILPKTRCAARGASSCLQVLHLTGDQGMVAELFTGPGHPRLPDVAAAVNAFPGPGGGTEHEAPVRRGTVARVVLGASTVCRVPSPGRRGPATAGSVPEDCCT